MKRKTRLLMLVVGIFVFVIGFFFWVRSSCLAQAKQMGAIRVVEILIQHPQLTSQIGPVQKYHLQFWSTSVSVVGNSFISMRTTADLTGTSGSAAVNMKLLMQDSRWRVSDFRLKRGGNWSLIEGGQEWLDSGLEVKKSGSKQHP